MSQSALVLPEPAKTFHRPVRQAAGGKGAMNFVALRMLTGDRAKYMGLIFAIALSSFLIAEQVSIFAGLLNRMRSQILDVTDADIWVMDPAMQYVDEVYALRDDALYRVRGVPGIRWAVPLFKGQPVARALSGRFRSVIVLGIDDASLAGAPRAGRRTHHRRERGPARAEPHGGGDAPGLGLQSTGRRLVHATRHAIRM
jgi:hypothetical protein